MRVFTYQAAIQHVAFGTLATPARCMQVHRRILKQWEDLKAAPAGSIKSRIHRWDQTLPYKR